MSYPPSGDDQETAPLNPRSADGPASPVACDDPIDGPKPTKDLLHIRVLYSISLIVSAAGLGCALWGYQIVLTSPFDDHSKKSERELYESNFLGMQSIVILLVINVLWSAVNLRLALRGKHNDIWPLNMVYDFLLWAMLIAFGVLNMLAALWDRRLCDGWNDEDNYAKCDEAMFRLLVVELVAINLGLLVAVTHFIILIGRCCLVGQVMDRDRARWLRRQAKLEEGYLMELMERRKALIEENEALEARRKSLPLVPDEDVREVLGEEDLIDMVTNEGEQAISVDARETAVVD